MRLIAGMILGALLTIGGAYWHDTTGGSGDTDRASLLRPMVNWDVVNRNWEQLAVRARQEFTRLSAG
jgi:hypothetical protein